MTSYNSRYSMQPRRNESPAFTRLSPNYRSARKSVPKAHTLLNQHKLKVFVKFKPQSHHQFQQVRMVSGREVEVKTTLKNKMYEFDHVFGSQHSHSRVFEVGCKQLIDHVLTETERQGQANHGLVFVYGNTGTGKTYSMGLLSTLQGDSAGIVPNSVRYIFNQLSRNRLTADVSVSFSEIYMDEVYDLLALEDDCRLTIRQDSVLKTKQPYIDNQVSIAVNSVEQAYQIINIGLEKRRVAEQKMNRKSSRGHGLITLKISPQEGKPGKICFIDLAGCERLKQTESKGVTMQEALHINSSLSSLQTLLMRISQQKVRDYRSSKLTRVLQPYFESGRIHLFVTSTTDSPNAVEFGRRCKGIRFMERDLSPVRPSVAKTQNTRLSKQNEELIAFRAEAIQREKQLVACILHLARSINKLSQELQASLGSQNFHSKYSFSQILGDTELEASINQRIAQQQAAQQSIIEQSLNRVKNLPSFKIDAEEISHMLSEPMSLTRDAEARLGSALMGIRSLGELADHRNCYKKEFFTSELKVNLLENRCRSLEEGLKYLTKYMDMSDKRATRRLSQLGILSNGKENMHPQKAKPVAKGKSAEKSRKSTFRTTHSNFHEVSTSSKESTVDTPSEFVTLTHAERRSAIYIDQV